MIIHILDNKMIGMKDLPVSFGAHTWTQHKKLSYLSDICGLNHYGLYIKGYHRFSGDISILLRRRKHPV